VLFTGPGDLIEDLSELPKIPYDVFPLNEWLDIGRWYTRHFLQPHWRFADRVITVHGGRGCPFNCNFCYHHSKPRYRPMDITIGEAGEALERFDGNMLSFSDETTLPSSKRVREMLDEIIKLNRPIEYSLSSRFDILDKIDDNLLREMKETGCRMMGLGIESGSDRILEIIGKNFSGETIQRGLERLKNVGILPTVSIMVGQYTETIEDVEMSIALMRESVRSNKNIQYAFTITTPFPGSELHSLIFDKGLLHDEKEFYDLYFQSQGEFKAVVNLSNMRNEDMVRMYDKIQQVYSEEKARVTPSSVRIIESAIHKVAAGHERIEKRVLKKLKGHADSNSSSCVTVLTKLYQWIYEFVQIKLDNFRLKLRGIIVKK
jgi:radical SAM superfamily enzyme YgiQ (UPF0313 family)